MVISNFPVIRSPDRGPFGWLFGFWVKKKGTGLIIYPFKNGDRRKILGNRLSGHLLIYYFFGLNIAYLMVFLGV